MIESSQTLKISKLLVITWIANDISNKYLKNINIAQILKLDFFV